MNFTRPGILLLVIYLVSSRPLNADDRPTNWIASLLTRPLYEELLDIVPVSGEMVAGAVLRRKEEGQTAVSDAFSPAMLLSRSVSNGQTLCLTIASRDGRYISRNDFSVVSSANTTTTGSPSFGLVPFEGDFTKLKSSSIPSSPDRLAAKAAFGPCKTSSAESTTVVPVTLFSGSFGPILPNTDRPGSILLDLQLISGRNTITVEAPSSPGVAFHCHQLSDDGALLAFDTICSAEMSSDALISGLSLAITPTLFGRKLPPQQISIGLSPAVKAAEP